MKTSAVKFLSYLAAVVLTATIPAVAASGSIDIPRSQITATFRQMHVPVEGRFKTIRGTINFDPDHATAGRASIEIDTASFDVGAEEYNYELHTQEWFDTTAYPQASFVASQVVPLGQNRFEAQGSLTLKGKTQAIKVAFTQHSDGPAQVFEGEVPISRKAYAIGSAQWNDVLEDQVIVKFRIINTTK
ncbi:MAG: YceI family protein [Gammaproteobacteria bacterium]|nr:YceI family protein [Gammaproteobacteria bacterium]